MSNYQPYLLELVSTAESPFALARVLIITFRGWAK